jgi:hypothetical protein
MQHLTRSLKNAVPFVGITCKDTLDIVARVTRIPPLGCSLSGQNNDQRGHQAKKENDQRNNTDGIIPLAAQLSLSAVLFGQRLLFRE